MSYLCQSDDNECDNDETFASLNSELLNGELVVDNSSRVPNTSLHSLERHMYKHNQHQLFMVAFTAALQQHSAEVAAAAAASAATAAMSSTPVFGSGGIALPDVHPEDVDAGTSRSSDSIVADSPGASFYVKEADSTDYRCNFCDKRFKYQAALRQHERVHQLDRPFSCTDCGKGFVQKTHLIRHRLIHTGEKPFSCTECGKSFNQSNNLNQHLITHRGVREYPCRVCAKQFTLAGNRKKHELRCHKFLNNDGADTRRC